jgi:stringent starvation protein B
MTSTKPYLIRAFYEWILDNNLTPYILVNAEKPGVLVPQQHIKDGQIIFNISPGIVQSLIINNEIFEFKARFSGILKHIYGPTHAIMAIYAKENGRGMAFDAEEDDDNNDGDIPPESQPPNKPTTGKKPNLTVVK